MGNSAWLKRRGRSLDLLAMAAYPVPVLGPAFARRFEFLTWNQCSVSLVLLSLAVSGIALSFDVRGAHKLILVDEQEQGFSCFVIKDKWFAYRLRYFGARWAGYWFARAGGQLVRFLHRFIRLPHGLLLYVDGGLLFLPAACAVHLASSSLMFLVALGPPLLWEQLQFSRKWGWIGAGFPFGLSFRGCTSGQSQEGGGKTSTPASCKKKGEA